MLKYIFTTFFLVLRISGFALQESNPAIKYFYVSTDGNDDNPGTIDNPVATFKGAQELVRDFKQNNPAIPITVILGEVNITCKIQLFFYQKIMEVKEHQFLIKPIQMNSHLFWVEKN